jgi:hypothetical protein
MKEFSVMALDYMGGRALGEARIRADFPPYLLRTGAP